jgi:hypothetical protein
MQTLNERNQNGDYYYLYQKNRGRIEIQPRCKIQYPMKNRYKDAH